MTSPAVRHPARLVPHWFRADATRLAPEEQALLRAVREHPGIWSFKDVVWPQVDAVAQSLVANGREPEAEALLGSLQQLESGPDGQVAAEAGRVRHWMAGTLMSAPTLRLLETTPNLLSDARKMLLLSAVTPLVEAGPTAWASAPAARSCPALKTALECAREGRVPEQVALLRDVLRVPLQGSRELRTLQLKPLVSALNWVEDRVARLSSQPA